MLRIKTLAFSFGLSLLLGLPSQGFADPVLSIAPVSSSVAVGDTFTIGVNIAAVTDLYDFQFDLSFDPAVLEAVNTSEGTFLSSAGFTFFLPGTIDNAAGTITFNADTLLSAISGASGGGTLELLDFTALASGTSDLTISNEILQDSSGAILSDTTTGGTVTASVSGGGGTTSPVPETSTFILLGTGILGLAGAIRHRLFQAGQRSPG